MVFLVSHSSPGGVQELWISLATSLKERGFATQLVALYPHSHADGTSARDERWTFLVDRRPSSIPTALGLLTALVRLFRRERPAVVLSAMPAANVAAAALSWLSRAGTPVIISHHSPVDAYNRLLDAIDSLTGSLANVARVVCVSQAVSHSLERKPAPYAAKRCVVLNALPPDVEMRLSALADARRRRPTGRVVVAAGRLSEEKNYAFLLRATALLPDVEVRIVGDGPDRSMLEALARRLGVTDRVEFLGNRTRTETLELLARGDVFVQPSLYEGHSLALLEAAGLGLPLVVSRVPAQVEGVTASDGSQCGITVELGDDAGFASAIRTFLDDPGVYKTWAARARHLSAANSYGRMVVAYSELITEIAMC